MYYYYLWNKKHDITKINHEATSIEKMNAAYHMLHFTKKAENQTLTHTHKTREKNPVCFD